MKRATNVARFLSLANIFAKYFWPSVTSKQLWNSADHSSLDGCQLACFVVLYAQYIYFEGIVCETAHFDHGALPADGCVSTCVGAGLLSRQHDRLHSISGWQFSGHLWPLWYRQISTFAFGFILGLKQVEFVLSIYMRKRYNSLTTIVQLKIQDCLFYSVFE